MRTITALSALGGSAPSLITPDMQGRFAQRTVTERPTVDLGDVRRAIQREASAKGDPKQPVIDLFTASLITAAVQNENPRDMAIAAVARTITAAMKNNPLGSVTLGMISEWKKVASGPVIDGLVNELARRGYRNIDRRKAEMLAAQVADQDSFESVCKRAGIDGVQPEHIQLRTYIATIVNRRLAGADPYDVEVVQQQEESMGGPKREDGAAALAADDMGALKKALLAGKRVQNGDRTLAVVDGRVSYYTAGKVQMHPMYRLAAIMEAFVAPSVNEQVPPAVDIDPEDGANILGGDSQVEPGFDNPAVFDQTKKNQKGTSTSVVGTVQCLTPHCGEQREVHIMATPGWALQPVLWRRAMAAGSYPDALATYMDSCTKLRVAAVRKDASPSMYDCPKCKAATMVLQADGGKTLGKDTQTKNVDWIPKNRGPRPSKPGAQPGTSLPPKEQATERDHQKDDPSWGNPGPIETSRKGPIAVRDLTVATPTRPKVDLNRVSQVMSGRKADYTRFAFVQQGNAARTERDDTFSYTFGYNVEAGRPSIDDVQSFIDASGFTGWAAMSARDSGYGRIEVRVARRGVANIGTSREQKAARIKYALGSGDVNNDPAGMGSDFDMPPSGLNNGTTAGVEKQAGWQTRFPPWVNPHPSRVDYDSSTDSYIYNEPSGEVSKYMSDSSGNWSRYVKGPDGEFYRDFKNDRTEKSGAKISEGWGENGTFERSVEAESAEDLWNFHQGLNGKPVTWKPKVPATPDQPQAQAEPPVDKPQIAPPAAPEKTNDGKAHVPDPNPKTMSGQIEDAVNMVLCEGETSDPRCGWYDPLLSRSPDAVSTPIRGLVHSAWEKRANSCPSS